MWDSLSFGMDSYFGVNFDAFPQLPSSTSFSQFSDRNAFQSSHISSAAKQYSGMFDTADGSHLFELVSFGHEMQPGRNSGYRLMEKLPWFQLRSLIERPGLLQPFVSPMGGFDAIQPQLALEERHKILSGVLSSNFNNRMENPILSLTAHLLQLIPERTPGELHEKASSYLILQIGFVLWSSFNWCCTFRPTTYFRTTRQMLF
jgi:hypothetical protein